MEIVIRPEEIADYNQIANLTYSMFVERKDEAFKPEPLLTAVLRGGPRYDPELCLVAADGVRVAGYALFSPFDCVILGERRHGVYLAPLCVAKTYRNRGIGARLLEAGHEAARARGYEMAMLRGQPEYYAKHGYLPRMYALTGARAYASKAEIAIAGLAEASVTEGDLPFVVGQWKKAHGNDRLAWFPGGTISQWFTHSAQCRTSVFFHDGKRVGYVKYDIEHPCSVTEFLVEPDYAPAVLERLRTEIYGTNAGMFTFSMTGDALAALFRGCSWVSVSDALFAEDSMMIGPLRTKDPILKTYIELARQNDRNIGVVAFPAPLDIG